MPRPDAGDVVVVHAAKVQARNGISLITNRQTEIRIYSAVQIPKPPKSASQALQPPCGPNRWTPDATINEYVSWLYHSTNKFNIPNQDEFRVKIESSLNVREKFSTLEKVQESRFYDIIVQVIKDPFDQGDRMNFWVTDYTENDNFFLFSWNGPSRSDGADYDRNLYTTVKNGDSYNWPGPFGKRSMQVTSWEPHATYVRDNVKAGDWVWLRNVHVKFGHNSANLEGSLHADRMRGKIQVSVLQITDNNILDSRLKEAIRRKLNYERAKKQQQKSYEANGHRDGSGAGTKRKAESVEPAKMSRRERRKLQIAEVDKKHEEQEKKKEEQMGLNKHSKSPHPVSLVSQIKEERGEKERGKKPVL